MASSSYLIDVAFCHLPFVSNSYKRMQLLRWRIIPCWPDSGQIYIISNEFWGPNRRRLFPRNVSGSVWRLERWLYSQACLSLLFYSPIQLFRWGLRARNKIYTIYDCFVLILKKKGNFLDTRDNSYQFRYFRFLALQNLQLNHPLNRLNSTP